MRDPIGVPEFLKTLFESDNTEIKKNVLVDGTINETTLVLTPNAVTWARSKEVPKNPDEMNFRRRERDLVGLEFTMSAQAWGQLCQEHNVDKDSFEAAA